MEEKIEAEKSDMKSAENKKPPPPPFSKEWFVEWARTLLFAGLIFIVVRTFLFATFVITSGSMEETLLVGDFLLVNKMSLGTTIPGSALRIPGYADPDYNDIIVFRADHAPGLDIVKRTIGIPGDTLWMEDGVLFRNGERIDEPYVQHDPRVADVADPDMLWQLDHVMSSADRANYLPTRDNWAVSYTHLTLPTKA